MNHPEEPACIPILKALGDESRWKIVERLLPEVGGLSLGELAESIRMSLYNASRHVRVLREAGILHVRREGRFKMVSIEDSFRGSLGPGTSSEVLDVGCCSFRFDDMRGSAATNNLRQHASVTNVAAMKSPARYIMIGGFLGAGKTTAVAALARYLSDAGRSVGLITNDQGRELVDTRMLRSRGFATEEISGGCFCCRFNSLVEAAQRLTTEARPEFFIAEPVGSCTDLVATVSYPLRRIYEDEFTVAPLSVLVDPVRVRRILGLEEGRSFSQKVLYIYRKQLEEADAIIISKNDLLSPAEEKSLIDALGSEFPGTRVFSISVRENRGLEEWFSWVTSSEQTRRQSMEVDYDIYADGEALLGWLNATIDLTTTDEVDAGPLLESLARGIQQRLNDAQAEVAHLKMTLSPDQSLTGEVAVVNLVRNDFLPEVCQELDEPITGGQIILNLRAEADPDTLRSIVKAAVQSLQGNGCRLTIEHLEHFKPGRPEPVWRDSEPASV